MALVENLRPWDAAALFTTATLFVWFLVYRRRDFQSARVNAVASNTSTNSTQPARTLDGKAKTYRLRGLPSNFNELNLQKAVSKALRVVDNTTVVVKSLASDPSRRGEKIATLELSKLSSPVLQDNAKAEWHISVHDDNHEDLTLHFDTHFRGWTPLHSSSDEDCTIDLIAVSGLASHAFGSFKERNASHMWLRDSLPRDIPNVRIFIYGYDTQLEGSVSIANLDDLANDFQSRLKLIRSYQQASTTYGLGPIASPERPLILLGHSLGGILIKAALNRMKTGDLSDVSNLKAIRGMLFFGVPNQGMPIEQWIPMVQNQPNRLFIEQLSSSSDILKVQRDLFRKTFAFEDSKVFSFYETKKSPTARRKDGGGWEMEGTPVVLVDRSSATHGRHWEESDNFIKAMSRTHSDLVKFSKLDDDYQIVLYCLRELTHNAVDLIESRFLSQGDKLKAMIDIVTLEEFLPLLSTPQQKAPSTMDTPLHLEPEFAWVFKNVDYEDWEKPNSECRRLLLTGREESNINMVSSHYTNEGTARTQGWVLHFCYPYAIDSEPATSLFIQTLLRQIISYLPGGLKVSFVKAFLRSVWATRSFEDDDLSNPQENWISSLLKMAGSYSLLSALDPILEYMKEPKLLVIIDGLDGTHQGRRDFFRNISSFCTLIVREHPNVRVLLTSQPTEGVVRELDGFSRIAFDEERKGFLPLHQFTRSQANDNTEECLQSLFFENTRRENIARGHNGSFEWLWEREEYKEWSESDNSSVLLVLGKPGSGKSTLTKYFSENLAKREPNAKSATVARYFYTARQGELQADHRSMLQSMIYDILDQNPPLFYFGIQHEYRKLLKSSQDDGIVWPYDVLKKVMLLLQHYPSQERLYLIIDALDEARQEDTRDVLDLLYNICASARHCVVKVFVASRPVGLLNRYVNQLSNILTLQDHTKPDIENFTHSFIENLERSNSLKKAADYIIQNAQGVFVWVELVGRQLQEYDAQGRPLGDIFKFLLTLPRELEEMYELMFEIMPKEDGVIQDSVKIFQLVLFARRLLTGREIVHALRIPDDPAADFTPSDTFIQDEIPEERYIMVCGGNFLAHSRQNGSVQVIHQTVREFFLRENGYTSKTQFGIQTSDVHIRISTICLRYLLLCTTNMASMLPDWGSWTTKDTEHCIRYLDSMPLANYALGHLKYHIDASSNALELQKVVDDFLQRLTFTPAIYLLENWVTSSLKQKLPQVRQEDAAINFRIEIFKAAVTIGLPTGTELLLTAGVNIHMKDEKGLYFMHLAAINGQESVVKILLDNQARPDVKDNNRRTPLLWAAEKGFPAIVRLLLEHGADIYSEDLQGRTAVHWAAITGRLEVVRLLLDLGAKQGERNSDGRTALHCAAMYGHVEVTRLLLDSGADLYERDGYNQRALDLAATHGHDGLVLFLLENMEEIDIDGIHTNGHTVLHGTAMHGHSAVMQALLQYNASANIQDGLGYTALHRSCMYGYEAVTRMLLAHGWVVDIRDNDGWTAMHWSAVNGHEPIMRILLDHGTAVDILDDNGWTAMHWAAENGHESAIRTLLEREADIDKRDYDGWTALHRASKNAHMAVVRILLGRGANVNTKDMSGWTPLHRASQAGHIEVVDSLLKHKAAVDAVNDQQETALHIAVKNERLEVIKLLLGHGTNVAIKNRHGMTALILARREGYRDAALLLSSYNI